jgi:hypothetical protein
VLLFTPVLVLYRLVIKIIQNKMTAKEGVMSYIVLHGDPIRVGQLRVKMFDYAQRLIHGSISLDAALKYLLLSQLLANGMLSIDLFVRSIKPIIGATENDELLRLIRNAIHVIYDYNEFSGINVGRQLPERVMPVAGNENLGDFAVITQDVLALESVGEDLNLISVAEDRENSDDSKQSTDMKITHIPAGTVGIAMEVHEDLTCEIWFPLPESEMGSLATIPPDSYMLFNSG